LANYQACETNPFDPYLTLFAAYGDDESPSDVREYPFGRGSRVAPYNHKLRDFFSEQVDLDSFLTATGPLTENPDPHKNRPDTHSGPASATRLLESPDILEVDFGRFIAKALSDKLTEEFREFIAKFTVRFDLRRFRTRFCNWERKNHTA
jgi:hypothetical protein